MRYRTIVTFSASLLGMMLCACSSQQDQEAFKMPVIPVHTAEVKLQDIPHYFHSPGTLKPAILIEIKPQTSGMLQTVHFTEGQFIKKGTPLFTIDSQPYIIRLHESEAQLAQNKAAIDSTRKKLDRYTSLAKKELIPLQEWDEMHSQIANQEAQLQGNEARVAAARLDLQRCEIAAPMNGRVGKLEVHPGNLINASQSTPLTTMANIEVLTVEFTITEREYQQLSPEHRKGNYPIEISSLCNSAEVSKGSLTFLDHSFDPQTGLLLLKGKMVNASHKFLPGQHVQVRIPIKTTIDAIVVPQKAVKVNQLGSYVYVIKEDKTVDLRPVKIGDEVGELVIVNEGLTPNELVVTDGHLRLSPGLSVEILEESK
ncbi:MAG: efflux RND transporter periplasmic adaptor subunit [Parachlamydiaceae bacterium]|nr:efflux RND transporter periplasmic adaptor subunit [Parachlamydiaceae bacterium]